MKPSKLLSLVQPRSLAAHCHWLYIHKRITIKVPLLAFPNEGVNQNWINCIFWENVQQVKRSSAIDFFDRTLVPCLIKKLFKSTKLFWVWNWHNKWNTLCDLCPSEFFAMTLVPFVWGAIRQLSFHHYFKWIYGTIMFRK